MNPLLGRKYFVAIQGTPPVSKVHRTKEIITQEGLRVFFRRFAEYFSRRLSVHFWNTFYILKSRVSGDYTITIDAVIIDLDFDSISERMKKKLRTKRYESREREFIESYLQPDFPTIDLGAGIGYTTSSIEQCVAEDVSVIGVEANEQLIPVLERTKQLNGCTFDILHAAYSSENDFVEFNVADDYWSSSLYDRQDRNQNSTSVQAMSISELRQRFELEGPYQLVVDIEGSEHDLIVNESDELAKHCTRMIVEFHEFTDKDRSEYDEILRETGFERLDRSGTVCVYSNTDLQ